MPVVVLWIGHLYTAHQGLQNAERADFDRMRLIMDRLDSKDPRQRIEAVNVFYFFVEKCELPQVFMPALQLEVRDDDPRVSEAAGGVFGYAVKKCDNAAAFAKEALANPATARANPETVALLDTAAKTDPTIAQTIDFGKLPKRVYIEIKDERQRALAQQIAQTFVANDFIVPGIERVNAAAVPNQTEIRFFHRQGKEEDGAKTLVSLLAGLNLPGAQIKFIPGYETSAKVKLNQFELWLAEPLPKVADQVRG